jgi:iron-sulfur cluster repair protein YtfE (RIC family)
MLLRQQLARLLVAVTDGADESSVHRDLAAVSESLRLHQRREDAVLYPVCERLFGGKEGAASVLRRDHAVLAEELEILGRESAVPGRVSRLRVETLRTVVEGHFDKEERVLFPLTAALLSGRESTDLARRLRSPQPGRREG